MKSIINELWHRNIMPQDLCKDNDQGYKNRIVAEILDGIERN